MRVSFVALGVSLVVASSAASATNIKWHPSLPLRLGGNLDPRDITDGKSQCLTPVGTVPLDGSAPSTVFTGSIIRDKQQLYGMFSVSAAASARFGLSSGSASFQRLNSVAFDSETINWAISATSDFGRYGVAETPRLTDTYSQMASRERASICGTEYVIAERREAAIAAVFSFKTSSKRTRDQLEAALNASWSGGNFSSKVTSQLQKALSSTSVRFTLIAKGGEGLAGTAGLVASFDDFDKARVEIANYMRSMTGSRAPVAEYMTALMPGAEPNPPSVQDQVLAEIWHEYIDAEQIASESEEKLRNLRDYWFFDRGVLTSSLAQLNRDAKKRMIELSLLSDRCRGAADACQFTSDPAFRFVQWPSIDVVPGTSSSGCNPSGCRADLSFSIMGQEPSGSGRMRVDAMDVRTSQPINSVCASQTTGQSTPTFRCALTYAKNMDGLEAIKLQVSDKQTGQIAVAVPLVELYPSMVR